MPNLSYTTTDIEGAVKVDLTGSIDPSTFEKFQSLFDELLSGDVFNIIINFQNLTYINSTGMGLMVQVVDQFREKGGQIVLLSIPPKVLLVMEMLGLQEFFTIVPDVKSALNFFAGGVAASATVEMHLKDDAKFSSSGGGPGRTIRCGHCKVELSVAGAGGYQCPRCRSLLRVNGKGDAETLAAIDGTLLELSLPACLDYVQGLRILVATAGTTSGVSPEGVSAFCAAIEACSRILIDDALGGRQEERIQICLSRPGNGFLVQVAAAGLPLSLESGALGREARLGKVMGGPCELQFLQVGGSNCFLISMLG